MVLRKPLETTQKHEVVSTIEIGTGCDWPDIWLTWPAPRLGQLQSAE